MNLIDYFQCRHRHSQKGYEKVVHINDCGIRQIKIKPVSVRTFTNGRKSVDAEKPFGNWVKNVPKKCCLY